MAESIFNREKVCRKTRTGRCLRRTKPPIQPLDGMSPSTAFKLFAYSKINVPASSGVVWYEYVHKDQFFVTLTAGGPTDDHNTAMGLYRPDGSLVISEVYDPTNYVTLHSSIEKLLVPGTYYIAVGMNGATFGVSNFDVTSPGGDGTTELTVKITGPDGWPNGLPGLYNTGQYLGDGSEDRNYILTYNDGAAGHSYIPRLIPDVEASPNDNESGWIGIANPVSSSAVFIIEQLFDLSDYDHTTVQIEVDFQVLYTLMGFYVNPVSTSVPDGSVYSLNDFPSSRANWNTYVVDSGLIAGLNRFMFKFSGSDPGLTAAIRIRMRATGTLL